jgi:hypothetical protein
MVWLLSSPYGSAPGPVLGRLLADQAGVLGSSGRAPETGHTGTKKSFLFSYQ